MARLRKSKFRKKRDKKKIFISIVVIFIIWISYQIFMPNISTISLKERMPNLKDGHAALVIDGDIISDANPIIYDNLEVLMPLKVINRYIDKTILKNDKYIIAINDDKYIRYEVDSYEYVVNSKVKRGTIKPIEKDNETYLPMTLLKKLYGIDMRYSKDTNILSINLPNREKEIVKALKNITLREGPSIKQAIVGKALEGDKLIRYSQQDVWSKVELSDGNVGYVKSSKLKQVRKIKKGSKSEDINGGFVYGDEEVELAPNSNKTLREVEEEKEEIKRINSNTKKNSKKVNVVWYQVSSKAANPKPEDMKKVPGMTVACFTWFEITDSKGKIRDKTDPEVIKWLHKNNYEVWALVSNPFADPDLTHEMLKSPIARENAIKQLINYAIEYDIDGINVDIESIRKETGEYYIQFIKELAIFTKINDITLSLDMYMPTTTNQYYGRYEIGKAVDYFCLMAYDEHWRTCKTAGSVASIPWVIRGLESTLEDVPSSKILLGMPSYTRKWATVDDNVIESVALGMDNAKRDLEENGAKIKQDELTGQNYGEYTIKSDNEDDVTYKIWLEDELSVEKRLDIAERYNLAGVATWKKGFEKENIWNLYVKYMTKK